MSLPVSAGRKAERGDAGMSGVAAYRCCQRNRLSGMYRNARGVLELPEGTIERTGTEVGDEIELRT